MEILSKIKLDILKVNSPGIPIDKIYDSYLESRDYNMDDVSYDICSKDCFYDIFDE